MHQRFSEFLQKNPQLSTPFSLLHVDGAVKTYHEFKKQMPLMTIYYAVKCNSTNELLQSLHQAGSSFDCASIEEIEQCLNLGADAQKISFGNTIKKPSAIRRAYELGVRLFACDSEGEVRKIAEFAPKSQIFVRILYEGLPSAWPLSRKFGCSQNLAVDLLLLAQKLGLQARGVSFHVGSQMHLPHAWHHPISVAHRIFEECAKQGLDCDLINCGGGFPGEYLDKTPPLSEYAKEINNSINEFFGKKKLTIIIEPGRGIIANHAVLVSEVILISKKYKSDSMRWVYIDAGVYNGLFDAMGEGIKFSITTPARRGETELAIIAGPTCDSLDTLYEKNPYELPLSLKMGDRLIFNNVGAYSRNVSSCAFNGFTPLNVYIV